MRLTRCCCVFVRLGRERSWTRSITLVCRRRWINFSQRPVSDYSFTSRRGSRSSKRRTTWLESWTSYASHLMSHVMKGYEAFHSHLRLKDRHSFSCCPLQQPGNSMRTYKIVMSSEQLLHSALCTASTLLTTDVSEYTAHSSVFSAAYRAWVSVVMICKVV